MSINSNKEEGVRGEVTQLRRIADILEEILKLVKKDNDPFGFNKAINWDKLEDPKVLKELEKIFDEDEKDENDS